MTRVLVGNDFSEDLRTDRGWTGWWVQRLAWFARPGDVLLLPETPDRDFLDYVGSLTGVPAESLHVVVAPDGGDGPEDRRGGSLSPARLGDPRCVEAVRAALAGREVTEITALWPDAAVARFARALGVPSALPGYGFVDQGGGMLTNSKSAFRTIAGGVGVPIPSGAVATSREVARTAVMDLLDAGEAAMVKHDFLSGGHGNEILSRARGVRPVGARRVVHIDTEADVDAYLDDRWAWLTSAGRSRPVVERYVRDSSAYFTEYLISDKGVELAGDGELLSAPYAVGQIMPAIGLDAPLMAELVDGGRRLCEALHAIGYRGACATDAIVTPDREVLFTEYNGRITGSTHVYAVIGRQLIGPGYGADRVILDRVWPEGWAVSGFADARDRLRAAGVGWNPDTRTGIVLSNAYDGNGGVMYCVVAEGIDAAWALDRSLRTVFAQ